MILRLWPWATGAIAERYEAVVEEIERRRTFTRREIAEALDGRIAYPHPAVTVVVAELRAHGLIRLSSAPGRRPQTFVCT